MDGDSKTEAQHNTFIYTTYIKNNIKIYHLHLSPMLSAINANKDPLVVPHADRLTIKTGSVSQYQRSKLSAILHSTLTFELLGYKCTYNASRVDSFTERFNVQSSSSWRAINFSLQISWDD